MTFCWDKCFEAIVQDACTVAYCITAWFIKLSNSGIKHLRFKKKAQKGAKCLELFIPELLSCRFYRCPVRFSSRCPEILNEPQCQETYIVTRAPNEDSDQPAHWSSLIKIFTVSILDSQGCKVSLCGLWTDQTARRCRLIWVFICAYVRRYVASRCGSYIFINLMLAWLSMTY